MEDSEKTILLVEDDERVRLLLSLFLLYYPAKLLQARNGLEALGIAREAKPDVIVTDLNMPVMDGITLIKLIRADEVLKSTPVIVLTGTAGEMQSLANKEGATAVLPKPIKKKEFINLIEIVLKQKEHAPK